MKEDLKKYYEDNKKIFTQKSTEVQGTLLLDAKKYAQKLTVTEEEVELLYEERKESLIEPEERYLNQILVSEEVKANKIYKILANKKNFLKTAKIEANLSPEDIDLGWNTKSELPEEIDEAVFNLNLNQVSKPIKVALVGT